MIDLEKLVSDEIAKYEKLMAEMVAARYTGGIISITDVVKITSDIPEEKSAIVTKKVRNFLNGLINAD